MIQDYQIRFKSHYDPINKTCDTCCYLIEYFPNYETGDKKEIEIYICNMKDIYDFNELNEKIFEYLYERPVKKQFEDF